MNHCHCNVVSNYVVVTQRTGESSPSPGSGRATDEFDSPKNTARMSAPNDVALGM